MIGMMWYSPDKTPVEERAAIAAAYYRKKYGQSPTLCFVHPSMLPAPIKTGDIEIRGSRSIMPNHFWLGVGRVTG